MTDKCDKAGRRAIVCFVEDNRHLLGTNVDCFITPAWNEFYPTAFTFGAGGYANDDEVRQRLQDIAAEYGLQYPGITNIHLACYGPTAVVRRSCTFSEMLAKHLLTHYFAAGDGAWPGWYRGVTSMYSGDIGVNHYPPDAQRSELLDAASDWDEPITRYPHIHCWHTENRIRPYHGGGSGTGGEPGAGHSCCRAD